MGKPFVLDDLCRLFEFLGFEAIKLPKKLSMFQYLAFKIPPLLLPTHMIGQMADQKKYDLLKAGFEGIPLFQETSISVHGSLLSNLLSNIWRNLS